MTSVAKTKEKKQEPALSKIKETELYFRNDNGEMVNLEEAYYSVICIQESLTGMVLAMEMFSRHLQDKYKMSLPEQALFTHLCQSLKSYRQELDCAAPAMPCLVEYRPERQEQDEE
jgi:hypothetical protein